MLVVDERECRGKACRSLERRLIYVRLWRSLPIHRLLARSLLRLLALPRLLAFPPPYNSLTLAAIDADKSLDIVLHAGDLAYADNNQVTRPTPRVCFHRGNRFPR